MCQLARIIRNLIRAEEYEAEHKEWLENLFHPPAHLQEGYARPLYSNKKPLAAPETAYKKEKTFVRRTNDR